MALRTILVIASFSLFVIPFTLGENCTTKSSQTHYIPIKNVTLADGGVRRGLALQIGSSGQSLAFQPNTTANNTYVFDGSTIDASVCTNSTEEIQCHTEVGGAFSEAQSDSWSGNLTFVTSGASSESQAGGNLWGKDDIRLNSSFSVPQLPIGLYEGKGYTTAMNDFGLGKNSTILNSLYESGAIASKVWSMWQGWTGAGSEHQMDGSLVLGGYDAAKTTGPNLTTSFTYEVDNYGTGTGGLVVQVTEIVMNQIDGTNVTIFGSATQPSSFAARIIPGAPTITMEDSIWTQFAASAGGTQYYPPGSANPRSQGYTHYWSMLYEALGVYQGDLTFTIASTLQIRIPNHQLVLPDYTINDQGQQVITNSSLADILIYDLEGGETGDYPILGQPFLTSAYLMVDLENSQFDLWQINPTTDEKLVAIGPDKCTDTEGQSPTSTGSPSTPTSSSTLATGSSHGTPTKHISGGAIAGIVIGVLAFFALFASIASCIIRRRKAKNAAISMDDSAEKLSRSAEADRLRAEELHQLHRRVLELQPAEEMDGGMVRPRVELDGNGLPMSELDGKQMRAELGNDSERAEMHG